MLRNMYYKTSRVPCIQQDIVTGYKHNSVRMRRAAAARMRCINCASVQTRRSESCADLLVESGDDGLGPTPRASAPPWPLTPATSAAADDDGEDDDDDEVEEERTPFPRSTTLALLDPRRAEGRTRDGSVFGLVGVRRSSMPPWQCRKFESSDPAKQQRCRWEMKHECACAAKRERERREERERELVYDDSRQTK